MLRKISFAFLAVLISAAAVCQETDSSGVVFPLSSADASCFIRPPYRDFSGMLSTSPVQVPLLGNSLEIIRGMQKFDLLTSDIQRARESIHMEYYDFSNDETAGAIHDLLQQSASNGVDVKLLVENISNRAIPLSYYTDMRKSGVEVRLFTPLVRPLRFLFRLNHRNHQKIAVIDSNIGYIGGMNLSDYYFKHWMDTHLRIEGPAASVGIDGVFWNMWQQAGTEAYVPFADTVSYPKADSLGTIVQIVSDGPFDGHRLMEDSYVWLLDNSNEYFYACTPYFAPPGDVLDAMKRAALRGVDVRLVLPGESDVPIMDPVNQSFYRTCLKSGIRIYTSLGRFNHSKTFVTDDYVSSIGSVNLDYRSFRINYEDNAFVYDEDVAGQMRQEFEKHCGVVCREVTMQDVYDRSLMQKIIIGLCRLLAPEM